MAKTTALLSALALGASVFAMPAMAQTNDEEVVPGNSTATDMQNDQEREAVSEDSGSAMGASNPPAGDAATTIVPGNTQAVEDEDAEERDAIAAGEEGAMGSDDANADASSTLVPGTAAEQGDRADSDEETGAGDVTEDGPGDTPQE